MENSKFRAAQEDIDMSAINTIFNRRDTQRVVENYEASMHTGSNNRRRPRRRVTNAKKFLTAIAALAMAGGITIGAFVNQKINDMPKGSLNSISGQIGEIVFVKGDDFIEGLDRTDVSILSQNTTRNAIDYYYKSKDNHQYSRHFWQQIFFHLPVKLPIFSHQRFHLSLVIQGINICFPLKFFLL